MSKAPPLSVLLDEGKGRWPMPILEDDATHPRGTDADGSLESKKSIESNKWIATTARDLLIALHVDRHLPRRLKRRLTADLLRWPHPPAPPPHIPADCAPTTERPADESAARDESGARDERAAREEGAARGEGAAREEQEERAERAEIAALLAPLRRTAAEEMAIAADLGARLVTRLDADYPAALADLAEPPAVLTVRGRLPAGRPAVAVVGSRLGDSYGCEVARRFAQHLAGAGIVVVSGLARGIDVAAHEGALAAAGITVAVVGCGVGIDYPRGHARLAAAIAERGAVVSELTCFAPPRREHFPRRGRLIAALAAMTLVVQATPRSGALVTADHARRLRRPVWAIPGAVFDPLSWGPHDLLRSGRARLAAHPEELLDSLAAGATGASRDARAATDPGALRDQRATTDPELARSGEPASHPSRATTDPELARRGEPASRDERATTDPKVARKGDPASRDERATTDPKVARKGDPASRDERATTDPEVARRGEPASRDARARVDPELARGGEPVVVSALPVAQPPLARQRHSRN
jgi:DNA processing protein